MHACMHAQHSMQACMHAQHSMQACMHAQHSMQACMHAQHSTRRCMHAQHWCAMPPSCPSTVIPQTRALPPRGDAGGRLRSMHLPGSAAHTSGSTSLHPGVTALRLGQRSLSLNPTGLSHLPSSPTAVSPPPQARGAGGGSSHLSFRTSKYSASPPGKVMVHPAWGSPGGGQPGGPPQLSRLNSAGRPAQRSLDLGSWEDGDGECSGGAGASVQQAAAEAAIPPQPQPPQHLLNGQAQAHMPQQLSHLNPHVHAGPALLTVPAFNAVGTDSPTTNPATPSGGTGTPKGLPPRSPYGGPGARTPSASS
eukprot:360538-Chlamydomonas_euryale.AAC.9